ncbi:hypothetical protein [Nocardia sp. NPDC127526]|uniref:hypothetical protein n=1 Tax=Nocardia sp. NPDC127526 TaxID=3345393 RepID=UPI00362DF855
MSVVVRTAPASSVFETLRREIREFAARHTLTREERDARLAGYAPTAILGAARR